MVLHLPTDRPLVDLDAVCRNAVLTLLYGLRGGIVAGIEHFQEHRRAALDLVRYGRLNDPARIALDN